MTDEPTQTAGESTEALQRQLAQANERLVQAELKSHAIRAGIIDVDCLRLLDTSDLKLDDDGNIPDAAGALARMKRDKPWLFGNPNTSHPAAAPAAEPPKTKSARDMTHKEWRLAREKLIRRR
jgi:hypothetical protein